MLLAYRIVNVFTVGGDRLSGNPLCVFEDARGLTDGQMQALARQMNLSETTFLLPAEAAAATARVRIFTPGFEMPFAGHPTLGTAHVVRSLHGSDEVVLEMKAGLVPVRRDPAPHGGEAWTLRTARGPRTRPVAARPEELARMLGLEEDAVTGEALWVDTGVEQLVIPVRTPEAVRRAQPDPLLLARWGFSDTRQEALAYLWAHEGPDDLVVRFFFTSHGAVIEDPATGSACANLGGWILATGRPVPVRLSLRQGDAVGRPSRLGLRVEGDGTIHVTGTVIELGTGTIELD